MENFPQILPNYFCASPISSEISSIRILNVSLELQTVTLPIINYRNK